MNLSPSYSPWCVQLGRCIDTWMKTWWWHFFCHDCILILPSDIGRATIWVIRWYRNKVRMCWKLKPYWRVNAVSIANIPEHWNLSNTPLRTSNLTLVCVLCIVTTFMVSVFPTCLKVKIYTVAWIRRNITKGCEIRFCVEHFESA